MNGRFQSSLVRTLFALILVPVIFYVLANAEATSVLRGKITDIEGRAVEGARVFAYDNQDVKRPADFMSAPTDNSGTFQMVLPPGRYYLVARLKKSSEESGPLLPGDKHSGEAVAVELSSGQEAAVDFTVADLKDAKKIRTKQQERPVKISGRIIDEKGAPVKKAYVIARSPGSTAEMPEYLSSWVNSGGHYTLYLPRGTYVLGCSSTFPPGRSYFVHGEITVENDASDVNIIMKTRKGP